MKALRLSLVALVLVVLAGTAPFAQEGKTNSDDMALRVADAQKANQAALARYSWKVKTNLTKEGGTQASSVTEMRFNSEGKVDATTITAESNVQQQPGLRGRRQEAALDDFAAYLERVMKQASQYIFMSRGTLVDVFDRGKLTEGKESVDLAAGDLFAKGDKLAMSFDPASSLALKLDFTTTLDQDTITGVVTFARMENGPNKPAKFELSIPGQKLTITSETYDWIEQK